MLKITVTTVMASSQYLPRIHATNGSAHGLSACVSISAISSAVYLRSAFFLSPEIFEIKVSMLTLYLEVVRLK